MTDPHAQGTTVLTAERSANLAENPYAGQGPVLLDIGGDIGAIILHLPASLEGAEIDISPVHDVDHHHHHDHPHRHVAVVGRPTGDGVQFSAVFPDVAAGSYELREHSSGGHLRVVVAGGAVTTVDWPAPR